MGYKRSLLLFLCLIPSLYAIGPMKEPAGLSGSVTLGERYVYLQSSLNAGHETIQIPQETITANDSAAADEGGAFLYDFKFVYTFDSLDQQLLFETLPLDPLSLHTMQALWFKQEHEDLGIFAIGALYSFGTPLTYKDPYLLNQTREVTQELSSGVALKWENIFNSYAEIELRHRKITIGNEQSGSDLTAFNTPIVTPDTLDRSLLNREGSVNSVRIAPVIPLFDTFFLRPTYQKSSYSLKGDAFVHGEKQLEVEVIYLNEPWIATATWGEIRKDYENSNPLFSTVQESDTRYARIQLLYEEIARKPDIDLFFMGGWLKRDSNINFYDEKIVTVAAGLIVKF